MSKKDIPGAHGAKHIARLQARVNTLIRRIKRSPQQRDFEDEKAHLASLKWAIKELTGLQVVAYAREVDGTGSLHMCAKGDAGAIPLSAPKTRVADRRTRFEMKDNMAMRDASGRRSNK